MNYSSVQQLSTSEFFFSSQNAINSFDQHSYCTAANCTVVSFYHYLSSSSFIFPCSIQKTGRKGCSSTCIQLDMS
uniref:Putative ovule protein n=1 Tax=Solanum chacoense TaxID=4108 RepID=A0A0V0GT06_SOLCH